MKKLYNYLLIPLLTGVSSCSTNNDINHTYTPYFKNVADLVESGITQEMTFDTFYDNEGNRFNVKFHYDLHFGLALHIEEYDLWNFLCNPNEGSISDDYESVVFTNSAFEESDLFARGQYVLTHEYKNNKDKFTLTAVNKEYELTKTPKEEPHYIDRDLVGEFEYRQNDETKFVMKVSVGLKEDSYPVTILINEGDKTFNGSDVDNKGTSTQFSIYGDEDGEFIKTEAKASFAYDESDDSFTLSIRAAKYSLIKTKGIDEQTENTNFFLLNASKIKLSCSDFEVKIANSTGDGSRVYLVFKELVEGGNQKFGVWFLVEDNTIRNAQNITNAQNLIFTNHSKYVFTHQVLNDVDCVDLYFDDVLVYENFTISSIE